MRRVAMGVAVLAAGAVTPASAAFKLTIGGCNSFNAPLNELENMRTDGVALGRFDLTIGDTAYNFDRITDPDNTANPLSSVVVEKGDFPDDNESIHEFALHLTSDCEAGFLKR